MPAVEVHVRAVRAAVGIADSPARSFTLVSGRDAMRFLQGMVTNDVETIAVGSAAYALLLTPKARVIADLRLTRLDDDRFLIDCDPAAGDQVRALLTRYRLAARAVIEPADAAFAVIVVAGPKAGLVILEALGVLPRADAPEGEGTDATLDAGAIHVLASACCGDKAFELIGERPALAAAWERLEPALARYDGAVIGEEALEVLRVEAGIPRFGAELDDRVMPAEAGVVERAVSFTKGCYVGQEPVARLHYRGHANRRLRAVLLDGHVPTHGDIVRVEGRDVGRVTSAVASPTLGQAVALAIVRREIDAGQRVDIGETPVAGELVAVPAYRWHPA